MSTVPVGFIAPSSSTGAPNVVNGTTYGCVPPTITFPVTKTVSPAPETPETTITAPVTATLTPA